MIKKQISTGLDDVDRVINYLKKGDNVVWQVDDIDHFRKFARPFAKKTIAEKEKLIYLRFAEHKSLIEPEQIISRIYSP